ncbi:hypothetical protein EON65_44515 [archaeon]|nr:MAG: hypothetical protein EON65_44515 [archaeon]
MKDNMNFKSFPPEAAELCSQLWLIHHGNILNAFYFQYTCNRLQHALVQADIITQQELHVALNDPSIYKPLFRAIAQGLPPSPAQSRYGLGKVSDYDLWHSLQDKEDVEALIGRLGLQPEVVKLARMQLRRDLKQLQERCLHGIYHVQLYPYYKLALLYVYASWLLLYPSPAYWSCRQRYENFCLTCLAVLLASWLANVLILYRLHAKQIKPSVFTRNTSQTVWWDLPLTTMLVWCMWWGGMTMKIWS